MPKVCSANAGPGSSQAWSGCRSLGLCEWIPFSTENLDSSSYIGQKYTGLNTAEERP